jgi:hypothetical protein
MRTLRTTGIVLLIAFAFGTYNFGFWPALAFLSGGIWGMLNLLFISALVRAAIRPDEVDVMRAIGFAIIKFPLLYVAGYFLLKIPQFDVMAVIVGSTMVLAVLVLKALGRAILGLDNKSDKKPTAQGVV